MPKRDIDYSKTIIYKLCCRDPTITDIYVGHTTNFTGRKRQHKFCCNNPNNEQHNFYVYQFIRENGGWDNWCMIVIEKFNCNNVFEVSAREQYLVETLNASLNKQFPPKTRAEYNEYQKSYRLMHRESGKEYFKLYYENNKNKISQIHAKYYENNKDRFSEINKTYYENNKNKLTEERRNCITCECGSHIQKCYKSSHR